ncbi:cutinase family protein [Nocardioides hwasunensis]|uniref:Cutinase family protein n=1 Tax=Nocardioides hwasunensis TaxID=397258 RepID=A0ABR8MEM1_9ACTN|nr:cutinase family protein [Nocardioides hwasunensis]MBD3914328.1 cutinase family protein [Nocardioides hwasunensis]
MAGLLLAGQSAAQAEPSGSDGSSVTSQSERSVATTEKRATGCAQLLVVAVDGNGQGKKDAPGPAVSAVTSKIQAKAQKQGRTVTVKRIKLATPKAATILRKKSGPGAAAVSKAGLKRWKKPIRSGVKAARKLVNRQLEACPDQQVMLVGYAQGAGVVHKVLQDLGKKDALTKVVGAVTVSDPSRVRKSSAGRPLGKPAAAKNSEGVLARFTTSIGDVPKPTATFKVVSVCHKGDLVCNPSKVSAGKALKLAMSYGSKQSRAAVREAANRAWAQASLWPVPAIQQVVVGVKEPISAQITVTGGSTTPPAAQFTPVSVPAGLSLDANGVISGQVDAPGSYPITYTLSGTSPATTPTTHTLTVLVREPSSGAAAGGQSSCAVRADGTAWCQGRNDFGQLGDGTTTLQVSPVQVSGTGWSRIATGGSFTCGVKLDGTLWCWGLNNLGQLGGADKATSVLPRQVGTANTWRDVSASWQHGCATQADGSAWCWGQNDRGQLGAGNANARSTGPVRVVGDQQWTSVVAGGQTTCGTTVSGTAYCWGENSMGNVGDGTITNRNQPTVVTGGLQFSQISTTWGRTCGVTTNGQVWCWGENSNGELGDGTRTNVAKPVQVSTSGTFTSVGTALTASCAVRSDGQVLCWGDNRYGQLGPAASGSGSSTPVAAGVVASGKITGGWLHLCAEGAGCWGANEVGQLGNGTITQATMPTEAAPPWGPAPAVSTQQMRKWGPAKVVKKAISTRPGVSAKARGSKRAGSDIEIMTFNLLGSQHTAPGGTRPNFAAPGRVRTEWAKNLINQRGSTLIGLSEPQPDQITALDVATNGGFSFYPGNTMGYSAAPQSVMWKDSEWSFVWGTTVQLPFMKSSRPQPLVRLRNTSTGREIYWVNAHLSPGKMQDDRDKGMESLKQVVKQLSGDGLPVFVTGDLNEHAKAFRRIACPTQMEAAVGGNTRGNSCQLPKAMRVDWIFGKGGTFSNTEVNQGAQVRRTTDHAVVSSRFTVQ